MNKSDVIELLKILRRTYPGIDTSPEGVEHYYKYLQDYQFESAKENIENHIMTDRFPPTIADIRGRLGDQMERKKQHESANLYFTQLDLWKMNAAPPPAGLRSRIHGS